MRRLLVMCLGAAPLKAKEASQANVVPLIDRPSSSASPEAD